MTRCTELENYLLPLRALIVSRYCRLYDEITREEIKILDEGVEMLEIPIAPSPRSRRRTMGSPKSVVPDLEKIGLKQYDVVQRGIKKVRPEQTGPESTREYALQFAQSSLEGKHV